MNGAEPVGFVARIVVAGQFSDIEHWLKRHAKGRWTLRLENERVGHARAAYLLTFDEKSDCVAFRARFPNDPPR
ncbi:MAG: hypothetical protein SFV21_00875 [Rhodospirillaceae bacterium]|nr:hypothetical protein [Rhodospirillaceae bacterium]